MDTNSTSLSDVDAAPAGAKVAPNLTARERVLCFQRDDLMRLNEGMRLLDSAMDRASYRTGEYRAWLEVWAAANRKQRELREVMADAVGPWFEVAHGRA